MKIAWIGTGVMGSSMISHFIGNHEILAYNRTKEKALPLQKMGVQVCDSIEECVKDVDVVFTMVGFPQDVENVYESIFQYAKQGTILIDMTTSSPALAKQLYEKAKAAHMQMLDAPVSGGDSGAKLGTLSIMVGGDKTCYDLMYPLFTCMGKTIQYMGKAGNGQHTKACNQIAVAGAVAAMSEALVYARHNGLDEQEMINVIKGGAGGSWQIENTAPRVLKEDFAPGFYIKHFIKDMHIIQQEMNANHLQMLNSVCQMYEVLASEHEENKGTQALLHYYDDKKSSK